MLEHPCNQSPVLKQWRWHKDTWDKWAICHRGLLWQEKVKQPRRKETRGRLTRKFLTFSFHTCFNPVKHGFSILWIFQWNWYRCITVKTVDVDTFYMYFLDRWKYTWIFSNASIHLLLLSKVILRLQHLFQSDHKQCVCCSFLQVSYMQNNGAYLLHDLGEPGTLNLVTCTLLGSTISSGPLLLPEEHPRHALREYAWKLSSSFLRECLFFTFMKGLHKQISEAFSTSAIISWVFSFLMLTVVI